MRRVLVTGGTTGIGRAIALAMGKAEYKVAVSYVHNSDAAKELRSESDICAVKWDVSDFQECKRGLAEVENELGGNIEILINNAGITRDAMLHKQTVQNWEEVIRTNLSSVFYMSRLVIEKMREAKYGRIINISSVNAHGAAGQTNYAAAKAGLEGFTKSLALESAKLGITANCIAPGYINTRMVANVREDILEDIVAKVPMKRLGLPDEIAQTALFLASDGASFITGAVIPVNGGLRT